MYTKFKKESSNNNRVMRKQCTLQHYTNRFVISFVHNSTIIAKIFIKLNVSIIIFFLSIYTKFKQHRSYNNRVILITNTPYIPI